MFICQHQTENNTEKSKLLLETPSSTFISYLWCLRVKQWEASGPAALLLPPAAPWLGAGSDPGSRERQWPHLQSDSEI